MNLCWMQIFSITPYTYHNHRPQPTLAEEPPSTTNLDDPGSPFDEEIPSQGIDEPLVAEEVAGHVDVAVVEQDSRLLRRRHQHGIELGHSLELPTVAATHFVAAQSPFGQMRSDVKSWKRKMVSP